MCGVEKLGGGEERGEREERRPHGCERDVNGWLLTYVFFSFIKKERRPK